MDERDYKAMNKAFKEVHNIEPNQTEAEKEVTPIKPKLTFDKEISQWVDIYSY